MEPGRWKGSDGKIFNHMKQALKFYEIKTGFTAPFCFLTLLAAIFSRAFAPELPAGPEILSLHYGISEIMVQLASAMYLLVFIKEQRDEAYTLRSAAIFTLRNVLRILGGALLYGIVVLAGLVLLIVPGIAFYTMFIFYLCNITDKRCRIGEAFAASRRQTQGKKLQIFAAVFILILILMLPVSIVMVLGNSLAASFVLSFAAAVIQLIMQRLIALLYLDLDRGSHSGYDEED